MNRLEFGTYLAEKRKERNKSLSQMTIDTGLSLSLLMQIEHGGVVRPRYDTIMKLSKSYKIPKKMILAVFYGGEKK
jgi:transcriptional regulator with XRE-family HTH domain